MSTPDRPNEARIYGSGQGAEITLRKAGRSMAGWVWDISTKTLSHTTPGFQPAFRFGAELAAEFDTAVAEAVAAFRPGKYERLTGMQLSRLPEVDREGFEWDRNMDDDVGHYVRHTSPVAAVRSVHFGRADIVQTIPKTTVRR